MRWIRWTIGASAGAAVLLLAGNVGAQPGPQVLHQVRFAGEHEVRVRVEQRPGEGGTESTVTLAVAGRDGSHRLHRGGPIATAVATRDGAALVAASEMRPRGELSVTVVDLAQSPDGSARRELSAPLPVGGEWLPMSVVACDDADGFTILWQAVAPRQMRAGRTFLARVSRDGRWLSRPTAVDVPWALAAIAWNGNGYHVALYFDGATPDQTRLSMVTLTPDGRPEQHPWWASRAGRIDEVQLVRVGERVVAAYCSGGELVTRDVTEPGQWGREPQDRNVDGPIAPDEEFVLRAQDGGAAIVRRSAATLSR